MGTWSQDPSEKLGRFRRGELPSEPTAPPPKPRFPHDVPIRAAGLSCDRKVLVALDAQGFVNGWDALTSRRLYRLPLPDVKEELQRLTFSPDGRFLAISPWSFPAGIVRVLDPRTGQELRRFERGFSPSFSPNSELLACSDGTQLRRWALKNGAELPRFGEAEQSLKWTAWSPEGSALAASREGSSVISLWEDLGRRPQLRLLDSLDLGPPAGLAFTPDGKTLAVGTHWGIRFELLAGLPGREYHSHEEYAVGQLKFSTDGRRLSAMSRHRRLLVWETFTGKPLFTWAAFQTEDGTLELSESGDVAIWVERGGIRLERIPQLLAGPEDGHVVRALCFTTDGHVVTGDDRGMIRVWDPATEKELRRHQVPLVKVRCFSRNGAWALFGGEDDPVGIWDLRAGREMLKIEATSSVWSVALSPDTGRLALGHADGTVALWNTSEKKEVARLRSDMSGITAVAFSSDGRSLAWGDNLGAVCMAEGREGREPLRFKARAWPAIRELIFSPDGKTLVATDHVGTSRAYSEPGIEPGDPQEVLRHHPEGNWAGFRSDPRWAASGFLQKNPAGREVLSADGRFVAGVTPDGRLVIWEAPGGK